MSDTGQPERPRERLAAALALSDMTEAMKMSSEDDAYVRRASVALREVADALHEECRPDEEWPAASAVTWLRAEARGDTLQDRACEAIEGHFVSHVQRCMARAIGTVPDDAGAERAVCAEHAESAHVRVKPFDEPAREAVAAVEPIAACGDCSTFTYDCSVHNRCRRATGLPR